MYTHFCRCMYTRFRARFCTVIVVIFKHIPIPPSVNHQLTVVSGLCVPLILGAVLSEVFFAQLGSPKPNQGPEEQFTKLLRRENSQGTHLPCLAQGYRTLPWSSRESTWWLCLSPWGLVAQHGPALLCTQ